VLGKDDDARDFAERARKIYSAFQKVFFDGKTGLYVDGDGAKHSSLHANAAALAFGLVPEKPIFTLALKSVDGEKEYLDRLYAESGEKIKYTRRGSTSAEGINGMIDIYDTFLPSGQPYKTIYINMYGSEDSVSAPKGFILSLTSNYKKEQNLDRVIAKIKKEHPNLFLDMRSIVGKE
jgi:hypothetical protein